jgi:uncharacterized protein (DUF952 family)
MSVRIYKICPRDAWESALREGVYRGSSDDTRDGFIHFSLADQLVGTAAKHFAGLTDLVLVSFSSEALGDALRFEASRGGALFPHLYGALDTSLAIAIDDLPWDEAFCAHRFPEGVISG